MTVKQAAVRLEVSAATVYALIAAGRLRCHRIGLGRGCIRLSEEQVAEYLARDTPPASAPVVSPYRPKHVRIS